MIRRRWLHAVGALAFGTGCAGGRGIALRGAGATLPAAQYEEWASAYEQRRPEVKIDYLPVGSGGGIRQLANGTVDFGATDVALDAAENAMLEAKVTLIPTALVTVAVAYTIDGFPAHHRLRLSGGALARIYLGDITRWDDDAIARDNPDVDLPSAPIAVVSRSDGGGTTALFAELLGRALPEVKTRLGEGRAVRFPVGIGARGSDGVVDAVSRVPNAIGYVEDERGMKHGLALAALRSAEPLQDKTQDAAFVGPRETGYPLVSPTFLVVPRRWRDDEKGATMAHFAYWMLTEGRRRLEASSSAGLLPLPAHTASAAIAELKTLVSARDGRALLSVD